jgi:hypothetical protein
VLLSISKIMKSEETHMKKLLILSLLLLSSLASAQSSGVGQGIVPFAQLLPGTGWVFVLGFGGPGDCSSFISGFCWAAGGSFELLTSSIAQGSCNKTTICKFNGTVGTVSTVTISSTCKQISFPISGGTLVVGGINHTVGSAFYSQTSCVYPSSGFMGGGSLIVIN